MTLTDKDEIPDEEEDKLEKWTLRYNSHMRMWPPTLQIRSSVAC